jgi:hypothetical protein
MPDRPTPDTSSAAHPNGSQQVSWWSVHVFVTALVAQCESLPHAGTPAWCALSDDDPRKLLALAAAGEHHVLRMETAQQARAEASRAVSAAADWAAVGRELKGIRAFHAARPWLRRVS